MTIRALNPAATHLIESFESCELEAYLDEAGVWTIGWGHARGVHPGQVITQAQADVLLHADLQAAQGYVERFITATLNDNQYGALVSLTFNAGTAPLLGHLGGYVNAGEMDKAADAFGRWIYVHIDGVATVSDGLVRRRAAEMALFLAPVGGGNG